MEILKCTKLKKQIKSKILVEDISFSINEGDVVGFIGPNGAGKTTVIKLILGLIKISSGKVEINGYDIEKDFVKAIEKVGAIVENPDSYMYLTGYQNLELVANNYKNITKEHIDEVVKYVGLDERIHDKVAKYSLGMRQRLGIAKALLNSPNVLILDEPTNGLDPEGIKDLRDLLKKLASDGMGILISSHNLAELESFCNKVCIIDAGVVIEATEVKEFKKNENRVMFKVSNTENLPIKDAKEIKKNSFIVNATKEEIAKIIRKLVENKIDIYEVREDELTLEEAFLKKTGGKHDKANKK